MEKQLPPPSPPPRRASDPQQGTPAGGPPGPPGGWLFTRMSRQQEILFNIMIPCLQLISQSTLTTVFPVSGDIARSFNIQDPSIMPWVIAAYATSFGTFVLIGGRLGDIFGHKSMVVLGYSWLSFWSVVVGLSRYAGYQLFFVARAFQGIGAAMILPNGLALLGRTYPPGSKQKVISFTIFGLCAPVGAYLGMVFGALFAVYAGWWWSFFTLAIITALLAATVSMVVITPPPTPKQLSPTMEKLRDMDWLGAVLGVGGLVCIQVSLVSAPSAGWSTQYIYMLLIIGILMLAFFVISEVKIAQHPLVPFKMLTASVSLVLGAVACGWATFGIWTWFLWKYMLVLRGESPLDAAVLVTPILPTAFIASAITAYMMRRFDPCWVLFAALVAFTFGPLLLAVDSNIQNAPYWTWLFFSLLITPFGMDMSYPAATMIISNVFPPHMQGVAGSLIATVVNYSISLGLGIASTVEVHSNNSGRDILSGIRGGWFTGVAIGGLGVLICAAFVLKAYWNPMQPPKRGLPPAGTMRIIPQSPRTPPTRHRRTSSVPSFRKESNTTVRSDATTVVITSPIRKKRDRKDSVTASILLNYQFPPATRDAKRSPEKRRTRGRARARSESLEILRSSIEWREGPLSVSRTSSASSGGGYKHARTYSSNETSPPVPALPTKLERAHRGRGSWESSDEERFREEFSYGAGYPGVYGGVQPRGAAGNKF